MCACVCEAIVSNDAMNICVKIFVWILVFRFLVIYVGVELLGLVVSLCLTFYGSVFQRAMEFFGFY